MPRSTQTRPQPAQAPPAPAASPAPAAAAGPPIPATLDEILDEMREVAANAETRNLSDDEAARYEALEAGLVAARRSQGIAARQNAYDTPVPGDLPALGAVNGPAEPQPERNPLAYTRQALDQLQGAIAQRIATRVDARRFENATLLTTTYGAPRVWGSNLMSGPRILHQVAGVPQQPADAVLAQFPSLTIPAAVAAAGEGATLTEFAASTAGSVVLGRFGRWTDLSGESLFGTDAGAIVGMHQVGIAKDLDLALINAIETAAGAAVGFTADVPAAIRKAIAQVIDATAAESLDGVVVLTHPDNAALLQDVTPTGGNSIGEPFQRFSGPLAYPSSAVDTGFITVANVRAGVRYFEAQGLMTKTDVASVKTDVVTAATAVVAGYALGLIGFAIKVDVVTP